jgi:hypothetical protein
LRALAGHGIVITTLLGESRVDFLSDFGAEPPLDQRAAPPAQPHPDAPGPAPEPARVEWPIARGRINDPI